MDVSIGPYRPLYPLSAASQKRFRYTFRGPWPGHHEEKSPDSEPPAAIAEPPVERDLFDLAWDLCELTTTVLGNATQLVESSRHTPLDQEQGHYGNVDFHSATQKCRTEWPGRLRRARELSADLDECHRIDRAGGVTDTIKRVLAARNRRFESFGETLLTAHEAAWGYANEVAERTMNARGYNSLDYIATWSMNLADVPTDMPWGIELEFEKNVVLSWLESGTSPIAGADTENKSLPESMDVRDLCLILKTKWRRGQRDPSQMDLVRAFVKGTPKNADSLIRQCRLYSHLWR